MVISSRDVIIERIQHSELGALRKLFAGSFSVEVHPGHITQRIRRLRQFYYFLRPFAKVSPWIKNLFNIYIIKLRGEIAGFIQVSHVNSNQLHLDYIAIAKRHRGKGLGTCAMRKLVERVTKLGSTDILLEVKSDNNAINLYRRLGFKTVISILHYKRQFVATDMGIAPQPIAGLRRIGSSDRSQLHNLYLDSVPEHIRRTIRREPSYFHPSLFVRHLTWVKNRLMGSRKREYVIERNGVMQAHFEIISITKINEHIFNLTLHKDQEELRGRIIRYVLNFLQCRYQYGTIYTTIYNDSSRKQITLKKSGFINDGKYDVMIRTAKTTNKTAAIAFREAGSYTRQLAQVRAVK